MTAIPPKQSVNSTAAPRMPRGMEVPVDPGEEESMHAHDASGALVSIHEAAMQAGNDSFPVLKAFQDYLESERQRARKRILLMGTLFGVLFGLMVAGFLIAGIFVFGHMRDVQERLLQAVLRPAEAPVAAVSAAPASVGGVVEMTEAVADPAVSVFEGLGEEVKQMRAAMEKLQRDNQRLLTNLATVSQSVARAGSVAGETASASDLEGVMPPVQRTEVPERRPLPAVPVAEEFAAPSEKLRGEAPATQRAPLEIPSKPPRVAIPAGHADTTIYLEQPGWKDPLPWRLFVPTK